MHLEASEGITMLPLEMRVGERLKNSQHNNAIGSKGHLADSSYSSSSSSVGSDVSSTASGELSEKSTVSNNESFFSPDHIINKGNDGDEHKKKDYDDDPDNENINDPSNEIYTDESEKEEDHGALHNADVDKRIALNGVDPTNEDLSCESDGSSDLENSYPLLPSAPVDTLIVLRQRAAYKELQLNEKLKMEIIADAKQRYQERQLAQRSKRRNKTILYKQNDGFTHLKKGQTNNFKEVKDEIEEDWMVDCSCGLREKNYDDGTLMIQCDSCSHWVHAVCANKQPEAVAQEKFVCFRCSWIFDCVCHVRRQLNHDDGHRMVECDSCNTWQHTTCVGIPMNEKPADNYRCPRCRKKGHRHGKSRDRERKKSHHRGSRDALSMDVRSSTRSFEPLSVPPRVHRSRRKQRQKAFTIEKKDLMIHSPSPSSSSAGSPQTIPAPPSSPPPPLVKSFEAVAESLKDDRKQDYQKQSRKVERRRFPISSSPSRRKRCRLLPSKNSKETCSHAEARANGPLQTAVTSSHRGKGLMLRGYHSASTGTNAPSSQSLDVRPRLPPCGRSGHSPDSRKRKKSSARNRLAKKLKMKKSLVR